MDINHQLAPDLLEEYKLCHQKAKDAEDNIWRTALLLGSGSLAGILSVLDQRVGDAIVHPWIEIGVSLYAVGFLLAWNRFARRWGSIQDVMFRRMEHLERQSQLRANLYIGSFDGRVRFTTDRDKGSYDQPILDEKLIADMKINNDSKINNYEHLGIRNMLRLILEISVLAWLLVFIHGVVAAIRLLFHGTQIGFEWLYVAVAVEFVIGFVRLQILRRKP